MEINGCKNFIFTKEWSWEAKLQEKESEWDLGGKRENDVIE